MPHNLIIDCIRRVIKGVTAAINNLLEDWMPYLKTITSDNGRAFAGHRKVSELLNIDYYFARPYHS